MNRSKLEELVARDYNEPLKTSEQYKDVYIHTFHMYLSEKHYEHLLREKFPKYQIKHFTMFKDCDSHESEDSEPLVISKLDGVSENYNDARPYISVFYNFTKDHSEEYQIEVKSLYDPAACGDEPMKVSYFRDFGGRLVLFRDNPSDCTRLVATGTWKRAPDNTGHYYLGTTQLSDERHLLPTDQHLQDTLSKSPYETRRFVMFTSVSKCKEVYDIKHVKNFIREFGASVIINQRYIETFVNGPRVT